MAMKITLTAIDADLAEAWQRHCGDCDFVEVHHGNILDVSCDAVVSPANSFGFMDGGIDMIYSRHFGWHVQERLQKLIRVKHHGELLVGAAEIVETDDDAIPFLIAAPTMRVPMILEHSVAPYLAARAVLLLAMYGAITDGKHAGRRISEVVKHIAFPGLGTGVGRVPADTCARQVMTAIQDTLYGPTKFPESWIAVQAQHQLLYTDQIRDLQH